MKTKVVIIGGGPAGAASAMFLKQQGIESTIIERAKFPRFHTGEAMTGECGRNVRALGLETEMIRRGFPVKTGAAVFGARGYQWWLPIAGRDEDWNLVPRSTWQVRRDEFDKMMLDAAVERGTDLIEGMATQPIVGDDGSVRGVTVRDAAGKQFDIESELVLDCSGMATFLANAGVTGPKYTGNFDKQIAIFSQVTGAVRDEKGPNDTLIFFKSKHHWAWSIPLSDEIVSIGVVCPSAYFKEKRETKSQFLERELRELNPGLAQHVPDRTFVDEVRACANFSYQVRRFSGKGFVCVGDAHRFVDPLFAFGLSISLDEASRVAVVAKDYLAGKGRDEADPFAEYRRTVEQAIDVGEDMLDAFWEHPIMFAMYVRSHQGEMIDLFAGRFWQRQPSLPTERFRRMLNRERSYAPNDDFDTPIGSRYHPERANIWFAEELNDAMADLPTE